MKIPAFFKRGKLAWIALFAFIGGSAITTATAEDCTSPIPANLQGRVIKITNGTNEKLVLRIDRAMRPDDWLQIGAKQCDFITEDVIYKTYGFMVGAANKIIAAESGGVFESGYKVGDFTTIARSISVGTGTDCAKHHEKCQYIKNFHINTTCGSYTIHKQGRKHYYIKPNC